MGDFNSNLFDRLARREHATKTIQEAGGEPVKVPVFTPDEVKITYESVHNLWEIIMLRVAESMKAKDHLPENERYAVVSFDMLIWSDALNRVMNEGGSEHASPEFMKDEILEKYGISKSGFIPETRLGIFIGDNRFAEDTVEIKQKIRLYEERGNVCPG